MCVMADQQWTQAALSYTYVTPWSATAVHPTAGPTRGGTFVQVRGVGLYASATAQANPELWRTSFVSHDANGNAQLDYDELAVLVQSLRARAALPETLLTSTASVRALAAAYDADGDGLLSFDEYVAARPGGAHRGELAVAALPISWAPHCAFGAAVATGIAGWTMDAQRTVVANAHAGEWIGCHTPAALDARAHGTLWQTFSWPDDGRSDGGPVDGGRSDGGPGGVLDGWRLYAVAGLPRSLGGERPAPQEVTHGLYSLVANGVLTLTTIEQGTGGSAFWTLPMPTRPAPVSRFFSVSFRLRISGGSGGDGVSWSYGEIEDGCAVREECSSTRHPRDLPSALFLRSPAIHACRYVDEMGSGDGLRLLLRTGSVQQASLVFNGSNVGVVELPNTQLRDAWRIVTVRLAPRDPPPSLALSTGLAPLRLAAVAESS
jgi:hypothetical protein